jgi:hypothetical protein
VGAVAGPDLVGVLASVFTRDLIDEVINVAEVREMRYRRLPARLMVVFVLASPSSSCDWTSQTSHAALALNRAEGK